MGKTVTVIDYDLGNIFSVCKALEASGAKVYIANTADEISKAEKLVLPGVGAFKDGISALYQRKLIEPLNEAVNQGKPLLGICLGMQLLLSIGYEFGESKGLDYISGVCTFIPDQTSSGKPLKRPHIGWSPLIQANTETWATSPLRNINREESVYFVHSYQAVCNTPQHVLAYTEYGGHQIAAAIQKDSVVGLQFHPERSGDVGLRILKEFLR